MSGAADDRERAGAPPVGGTPGGRSPDDAAPVPGLSGSAAAGDGVPAGAQRPDAVGSGAAGRGVTPAGSGGSAGGDAVPAALLVAAPAGRFPGLEWLAPEVGARRALPARAAAVEGAARHVTGNERFTPAERAEIYREQFWLRHTASLLEDFPALSRLLGQAHWESLVEGYLERHPPRHWSLARVGDALADYALERTDLPHPALSHDMARFEATWCAVFDAADAPRLDAATLAALTPTDWAHARLRCAPALGLLSLAHPVAALRRALLEGSGPVTAPAPAPERVVIYRDAQRDLRAALLEGGEFALFSRIHTGAGLLAACEALVAEAPALGPTLAAGLGGWLERWARLGWVIEVTPNAGA